MVGRRLAVLLLFPLLALFPPARSQDAEPAAPDETTLSGTQDICDGRDNNLDGQLDEGCDAICDNARLGSTTANQFTIDAADSTAPDIAFAGNQFGIAWIDTRIGYPQLCFARMDRNGAKLGADWCSFGSNVTGVSIGWSGSNFLVAVVDAGSLYSVRFAPSGGYQGYTKLTSSATATGLLPSGLAWVGTQYVVVWSDNRSGADHVRLAQLSEPGARLTDIQVDSASGTTANGPSVTAGQWGAAPPYSSGYGVAWQQGDGQIYFARVTTTPGRVGTDLLVSAGTHGNGGPVVAWTGGEYGIAFSTNGANPPMYSPRIDFTRVGPAGTVIAGPTRLGTGTSTGGPSLSWTGAEYLLSWNRDLCVTGSCRAYMARMSAAGELIGGSYTLNSSGASARTSVVWSGSDVAVTWYANGTGNNEIYTDRLLCCDDADGDLYKECENDWNDATATVFPGASETCNDVDDDCDSAVDEVCDTSCEDPRGAPALRVSVANARSRGPSLLAWSGSGYAVAWCDESCNFQRLDAAGQPVGTTATVSGAEEVRSLTWTGNCWGLAYRTASGGGLIRFDANGNALSQLSAVNSEYVWTGSEYGGAYRFYVGPSYEWRLNRLDASGTQLGTPMTIAAESRFAWNGAGYGIVYSGSDLTFRTIDPFGLNPSSTTVVSAGTYGTDPDIVWTGAEYGVTWSTQPPANPNGDIRFRRLDAGGNPIGSELAINNWTGHSWFPHIVWTGGEYGIAWQDDTGGGNVVFLARVSAAGALLGVKAISGQGYEDSNGPTLVWTGHEYAVAYMHLKYSAPGVPDGEWETWFQRVPCFGNDADGDGALGRDDCNDLDASVWARPSEVLALTLPAGTTTLNWSAPASRGATSVVYDTLRSIHRDNFVTGVVCIESNDGSNTTATDTTKPTAGGCFFYLVRAENGCPAGQGPLGYRSDGYEIGGRGCP